MKQSLFFLCLMILGVACNSRESPGTRAGSGGTAGSPVSSAGGAALGQSNSGGKTSSAGTAATGIGGSTGTVGSTGGVPGGGGNNIVTGFKCPAGPFATPDLTNKVGTRVPGAPPVDDFNLNDFGIVEGPVWLGDALYFSELKNGDIPQSRVLKLALDGTVSVVSPDSGSNGMAIGANGNLFAAAHKDGSISQLALPGGAVTPIVSTYMGVRFNSPNDLAVRSDGTIYFSDPTLQNTMNPQGAQRLYWVKPAPDRTVTAIADAPGLPNGVTLSPDEKTLYVSGSGLKKYSVMADGSLSTSADFVAGGYGDGMVVDCAGDLYVAGTGNTVTVFAPTGGSPLGMITIDGNGSTPTNVAFGGLDRKTLYITSMGNDGIRGVFSVVLNVPGFPY